VKVFSGVCHALFAYDVGMAIDLEAAGPLLETSLGLGVDDRRRPLLRHVDFRQPPLRLIQRGDPLAVGPFASTPDVEVVFFDFGAISVTYRLALGETLAEALTLSVRLDEDPALFEDSKRRVAALLEVIAPAVNRPRLAEFVEDYHVFQFSGPRTDEWDADEVIARNRPLLAQILRSERRSLGPHEVDDALASRIGYEAGDEAIVDWNAAILFQHDIEGDRAVLEYANVQLLEMRWLDAQLDRVLDRSYETLVTRGGGARGLRRTFPLIPDRQIRAVAELQMDSALLFEGVANALKLIGDQYLARLYRLAAQRMRIPDWHASIQRKLQIAESIHEKLSEEASRRRLEVLEWIIIVLIAVSILMMFL
jgi:hypothetical protein